MVQASASDNCFSLQSFANLEKKRIELNVSFNESCHQRFQTLKLFVNVRVLMLLKPKMCFKKAIIAVFQLTKETTKKLT